MFINTVLLLMSIIIKITITVMITISGIFLN